MRRPFFALGSLAVATVFSLASAKPACAECAAPLQSACIGSDTYLPHPGPMQMLWVGDTETVAPGNLGASVVADYQLRPLALKAATTQATFDSEAHVVETQVNATVMAAYGITDRLQAGAAVPLTLHQDGSGLQSVGGGALATSGLRDPRFGLAYALYARPSVAPERLAALHRAFALTLRAEMTLPLGDQSSFAGERTVVGLPSVAASWRKNRVFLGAEVGARVRPITDSVGARIGTQATGAIGGGVDLLPRELLSASVEGVLLYTFAEQLDVSTSPNGLTYASAGRNVPAEWLFSVRSAPFRQVAGDVSVHLGFGTSFDGAATSPRLRGIFALVYAPRGRDTDADTVPDRNDACPMEVDQPGPRDAAGCRLRR